MATAGQYFEVKVTFKEEVMTDSAFISPEAERFEKGVIDRLRESLGDADVEIRLYGSPSVGCFFDAVWVVVGAASNGLAIAAIGGDRLRQAVEHTVLHQWPNNVRALRASFWPIVENPDPTRPPDFAPEQTFTHIAREVDDRPTATGSRPPSTPGAPVASHHSPPSRGMRWNDWALVIFAALAALGYAAERMDDQENMQELRNRLSGIEQKLGQQREAPEISVECSVPPVTVSCPASTAAPRRNRSYSSRANN